MKFYLSVIGAAMLIISVFNIIFDTAPFFTVIFLVFLCTALQFALDGAIAIIIGRLPDRLFGADNPLYNVTEGEKSLYKKIKVRAWKDKVWELGGLGGFSKKNLAKPNSPEYIEKFIIECNKGVVTHRLCYFIGFLAMLTVKDITPFTIALPVALVNLYLNILPTLVLKYNTPTLKNVLYRVNRTMHD